MPSFRPFRLLAAVLMLQVVVVAGPGFGEEIAPTAQATNSTTEKPTPTTAPVPVATDAQQQAVPATQPARPGLTVVIRGLAGYWPGCDNFCARMRGYGESVQLYTTGIEAGQDSANIAGQVRAGYWSHIRIVGYSFGADAAVEYARDMQRYGVLVERLVLIEATTPGTIPGNVSYCYNIYESRPRTDWVPALRGVPVRRESYATRLVQYDVTRTRSSLTRLNHLTFSHDAHVQAIAAYQAGAKMQMPVANVAQQPQSTTAPATAGSQGTAPVQQAAVPNVPAPK
jgi:pimeloyl-ACP methyl ester carboxylesterase